MAVSHIINNKAGLSYTSYAHTGLQIPVYAYGVKADLFNGMYDNTDIFVKTMEAMGLTASQLNRYSQKAGLPTAAPLFDCMEGL